MTILVFMKKKDSNQAKNDKILFAFLATFLSIVGFVIAILSKREDKYVMYYAKHSLVIFIIGCVAGVLQLLFRPLPLMGEIISIALGILIVLIWCLSWFYALSGEMKEIPIISNYSKNLRF